MKDKRNREERREITRKSKNIREEMINIHKEKLHHRNNKTIVKMEIRAIEE